MEIKSKKIKDMNGFFGGIVLMAGGAWLMLSNNITEGRILRAQAQGIVRPDTYIRMLGCLVLFLAFLMAVRSINFKKEAETKALGFQISRESLVTFIGLVLFLVLLKPLGFAVVTFLFCFTVSCVYMLKETKGIGLGRKDTAKRIIVLGIFSLIMVLAVYLIFGKVLLVQLP
jgi:hypothetical protein